MLCSVMNATHPAWSRSAKSLAVRTRVLRRARVAAKLSSVNLANTAAETRSSRCRVVNVPSAVRRSSASLSARRFTVPSASMALAGSPTISASASFRARFTSGASSVDSRASAFSQAGRTP